MKAFDIAGLPRDEVNRFVAGNHADPFRVLGPHRVGDDLEIRVFRPDARTIDIVLDREAEKPIAAERIQQDGFFCATVPGAPRDLPYKVRITGRDGSQYLTRDPYQYGPIMGEVDLHLFAEGQDWKIYDKFGAHLRTIGDAAGVYFAVWAPNAQRVSVVGDFNNWDGRVNPMRRLIGSGVWELFVPGIKQGAHYKFEICTQTGAVRLKSDPFAFFNQPGKATASLVYDLERYTWNDGEWMEARRKKNWPQSPISIYEVHVGSWRRKTEEATPASPREAAAGTENRQLSYLEL
ncbi:MAG: 1,4-alpha-glucan branching enzyme, partial [Candidatus Udaeobacter sp.]